MKRRIFQFLAAFVFLLVAAGIAAPFLHADRYRGLIEKSLSTALGRQVTAGDVRLKLFTGPGFSVSNVIIADDPKVSAEPFAYVGELTATPRFWSLWTGKLEFSSLLLDDTHVNLSRFGGRGGEAAWNFEPLLRPRLLAAFPSIRLRGGRINFRFEGRKSTFYLLDTDLTVSPRLSFGRSPGNSDWELELTGEPARTDRPAHGFGALGARGRWVERPHQPGHLEMDLRLDRSEVGDVVALLNGRDVGVHGLVSGQMHVAGPIADLGLEGTLRVAELHGWEQSPPPGGVFDFRVSGNANAKAQHLDLLAEPRGVADHAVTAHAVLNEYLQRPNLMLDLRSEGLPVGSLPSLLRNFGAHVPDSTRMTGTLEGAVHFASGEGWSGKAEWRDAALELRGLAPLRFEEVRLDLAKGRASLEPVNIFSGERLAQEPAATGVPSVPAIGQVSASYSLGDGSYEVDLASDGGPLTGLLQKFPVASAPLLSGLRAGNWSGSLRYAQSPALPGHWTGDGTLTDAVAVVPAVSVPVRIVSARVHLDGPAVQLDRLTIRAGDVIASGEYRYAPTAENPHQFRLSSEDLDIAQLEVLFRPVLVRRVNLIDLALTLGRLRAPEWLRSMRAEGSLQIDLLHAGPSELRRVRTKVLWDGTQIAFNDVQTRVTGAVVSGRLALDVRDSSTPRYSAIAKMNGLEWQDGLLNGTFRLRTSGSGIDMLTNLKVTGAFDGQGFEVDPVGTVDRATGTCEISWGGVGPRILFPEIVLVVDGETWTGSGGSEAAPNEVLLTLSSRGKQKSLAGSLTDPAKGWIEK